MTKTDLHKALGEIEAIRGQVARASEFRGYGPASVAATGLLALLAALVQSHFLKDPANNIGAYVAIWVTTAGVAMALIGAEAVIRAQRFHLLLANPMLELAAEQFVPAILGGVLLTLVLLMSARESLWMLPGLWQLVFSLGVFSSCKLLPRPMLAVGVWYRTSGVWHLASGQGGWALSPWAMGVPFGVGQLLVAAVLGSDCRDASRTPPEPGSPTAVPVTGCVRCAF